MINRFSTMAENRDANRQEAAKPEKTYRSENLRDCDERVSGLLVPIFDQIDCVRGGRKTPLPDIVA